MFPELSSKNKWFWASLLFPIIIDYLNTRYYDYSISWFLNIFKSSTLASGWIIIFFYIGYIISLLTLGWLAPYRKYNPDYIQIPVSKNYKSNLRKISQVLFLYTSIGFGIILLMLLMHTSGLYDEIMESNANSTTLDWMFWIGVGLFFIQIIATQGLKPKFNLGSYQYFIVFALNVILAAVLVDLSTAGWIYFLASEIPPDPHRSSKLAEFIALFLLYAFFFAQPRLLFMNRGFSWLSFTSALIAISYFLWNSLNLIEL
ncbi:MAG: hypothetical protein ABFS35_00815 [Bacteroidota bacterium]